MGRDRKGEDSFGMKGVELSDRNERERSDRSIFFFLRFFRYMAARLYLLIPASPDSLDALGQESNYEHIV